MLSFFYSTCPAPTHPTDLYNPLTKSSDHLFLLCIRFVYTHFTPYNVLYHLFPLPKLAESLCQVNPKPLFPSNDYLRPKCSDFSVLLADWPFFADKVLDSLSFSLCFLGGSSDFLFLEPLLVHFLGVWSWWCYSAVLEFCTAVLEFCTCL